MSFKRKITRIGIQINKAFSPKDYKRYFPENFDPRDQSGKCWPERSAGDTWLTCPNPDDYASALWAVLKDKFLPKHYPQLSESERDEIAHIASCAYMSGVMRGHKNALNIDKSLVEKRKILGGKL